MRTEVHVYAFSVAANVLLSFFPFLIVMMSLFRYVFRWDSGVDAINLALTDYFPDVLGEFISRNLTDTVEHRGGKVQITSMLLLMFTANGIFEPLEVAFNRAWGIAANRSFLKNQLVSLGLIFGCGGLALLSIGLTALNQESLRQAFGGTAVTAFLGAAAFKIAAMPLAVFALFLIYWLLPNGRPRALRVLPAAIVVGVLLEVMKYMALLVWPWFFEKLRFEYGPFKHSASLIFLAFFSSMLVLAGAEWSARRRPETFPCPPPSSPEPPPESEPSSPESSPPAGTV